ncbi:MAG: metallophosphoesterase [Rikenellaceae bacterium]
MKIVAISDLHGYLPQLPEADVICIAGDITADEHTKDVEGQWKWYNEKYLPWVEALPARKVITIAGNHDYCFLEHTPITTDKHIYLNNSGVEIDGYTFYGSPNTRPAINNYGFSKTSAELTEIFNRIPDKLDFLICHSAPYGVNNCGMLGDESEDLGNKELTEALKDKNIGYIFCGHIHTGNHNLGEWRGKKIANVSYCKENKVPAYEPLVIFCEQ